MSKDLPDDAAVVHLHRFVILIAHGDDKHRLWLHEALNAYICGDPIPREPKDA